MKWASMIDEEAATGGSGQQNSILKGPASSHSKLFDKKNSMKISFDIFLLSMQCLKLAYFLVATNWLHQTVKLSADEQQVGWAVTEDPNNHHN